MCRTYKCIESFYINEYDEDGFDINKQYPIYEGEIFRTWEDDFRILGNTNSIRLTNNRSWLEIDESTLNRYFQEILVDYYDMNNV